MNPVPYQIKRSFQQTVPGACRRMWMLPRKKKKERKRKIRLLSRRQEEEVVSRQVMTTINKQRAKKTTIMGKFLSFECDENEKESNLWTHVVITWEKFEGIVAVAATALLCSTDYWQETIIYLFIFFLRLPLFFIVSFVVAFILKFFLSLSLSPPNRHVLFTLPDLIFFIFFIFFIFLIVVVSLLQIFVFYNPWSRSW